MMNREIKYNEGLFDLLSKQAAETEAEREYDALVDKLDDQEDYLFPEAFEARMQTIIHQPVATRKRRFGLRVAIIAVLLFALLFTLVATPVGAYMEQLYHFFFSSSVTNTTARQPEAYEDYIGAQRELGWSTIYIPTDKRLNNIMPEMNVNQMGEISRLETIYFLGSKNVVIGQRSPILEIFEYDLERDEQRTIEINGITAYIHQDGEATVITWNIGDFSLSVRAELDEIAVIEIAEGLKPISE